MKVIQYKTLTVSLIGLLFLFSCKKKDTVPASTGAGTTGGTVSNGIYGNLQAGYIDFDYGAGVVSRDSSAIASFYAEPMSASIPANIYAGTVTINGLPMTYNTPQNYYDESTHSANMQNLSWAATGSGTVTAFSYSYSPIYPKVTTPINVPDTCYKSSGISVSVNGITNSNGGALVYVMQSGSPLYKSIFTSSGTVNFSPTDLASFSTNSPIFIQVLLTNTIQQAVGSVKYQFTSTYTFMKYGYLK